MLSLLTKSATAFLDCGEVNRLTTTQHVFHGTVALVGQPSQRPSLLTEKEHVRLRGETVCLLRCARGEGQSEGTWLRLLQASCTDLHCRCVATGAQFCSRSSRMMVTNSVSRPADAFVVSSPAIAYWSQRHVVPATPRAYCGYRA